MSINSGPTNNENPFYKANVNYCAIPNPFEAPNIIKPSVLQSPPKQSPFITVVATTPTPPPLVSASSAMSMVQQPSMAYASMIQQQTEGLPWKCPDWMATNASSTTDLVEFNSQSFGRMPFKRKAATAINPFFKSKQLITEEKVAAELNGLHISSDYKQHSVDTSASTSSPSSSSSSSSSSLSDELAKILPEQSARLTPETLDIEEKLRNAQRITICDGIRKLADEPLLPQAILDRLERPCRAVVLWQPPKKLADLVETTNEQSSGDGVADANANDEEEMIEMDSSNTNNNNNNVLIDLNNQHAAADQDESASMDLDL